MGWALAGRPNNGSQQAVPLLQLMPMLLGRAAMRLGRVWAVSPRQPGSANPPVPPSLPGLCLARRRGFLRPRSLPLLCLLRRRRGLRNPEAVLCRAPLPDQQLRPRQPVLPCAHGRRLPRHRRLQHRGPLLPAVLPLLGPRECNRLRSGRRLRLAGVRQWRRLLQLPQRPLPGSCPGCLARCVRCRAGPQAQHPCLPVQRETLLGTQEGRQGRGAQGAGGSTCISGTTELLNVSVLTPGRACTSRVVNNSLSHASSLS